MSTSERSKAYGRVVRTLRDLGPTKLGAGEQDVVREAADTLLFSPDPSGDENVGDAIASVESVAAHLVESGRWTESRASELVDDVLACGRLEVARAQAA
jgi:hypothetical protein